MAGWSWKWFGGRQARSVLVEDYSVTLGDEWFSVVSGDEPGTTVLGIISSAGNPAARVISTEQAARLAEALMSAVWADSVVTGDTVPGKVTELDD